MMKKAKMKMNSQSFKCSNPECGMVLDNPIIVQDLSSKNEFSYSACPYCLTEMVIEKASEVKEERRTLKKRRAKIEEVEASFKKPEKNKD